MRRPHPNDLIGAGLVLASFGIGWLAHDHLADDDPPPVPEPTLVQLEFENVDGSVETWTCRTNEDLDQLTGCRRD